MFSDSLKPPVLKLYPKYRKKDEGREEERQKTGLDRRDEWMNGWMDRPVPYSACIHITH